MWNSSGINEKLSESYNDTNFDELKYLSQMLGPQRQPLNKLIPLTVVYTVMSITGIFGNLSVCCVILRIPSMRSATNYYLFSLAVSDLLILLLGKNIIKFWLNNFQSSDCLVWPKGSFRATIFESAETVYLMLLCYFGDAVRRAESAEKRWSLGMAFFCLLWSIYGLLW